MSFEIILLAAVAAFLGLRLYSVLGKRTGHEQKPMVGQPAEENQPIVIAPAPTGSSVPQAQPIENIVNMDETAESGLRSIANADRLFDAELFLEGAKSAYGIVLEAFWKGDKETLKMLCDDDVYESFEAAIDAREERGEIVENRLIRIEEAKIQNASFDRPMARITVQFDADIAALIKDKDGNSIGGSMTDAVETHDVWTFMRDVKSTARNWVLDETDEA